MTISFVRGNFASGTAITSLTCNFTSNDAGNLLVVSVAYDNPTNSISSTITDTSGNIWRLVLSTRNSTALHKIATYYAYGVAPSAGTNTVTLTLGSTANNVTLHIQEYKSTIGAWYNNPLDKSSSNSGSGTALDSTSTLPTSNNSLIYSFGHNPSGTISAGAGMTLEEPAAGGAFTGSADAIQTTATATTGPLTASATGNWAIHLAVFADAIAGTPYTQFPGPAPSPRIMFYKQNLSTDLAVSLDQTAFPIGLISDENFGFSSVSTGSVTVSPVGITTNETTGFGTVNQTVNAFGINSNEISGFSFVSIVASTQTISPVGIASNELSGNSRVDLFINASGIQSVEAFGVVAVGMVVSPTGISGSEISGYSSVNSIVSPAGITTSETNGFGVVTTGTVTVLPFGIGTREVNGNAVVTPGAVTVSPIGISSNETIGYASVAQSVSTSGISSTEILGTSTVNLTVSSVGISSSEAIGSPTVNQTVTPTGISSNESTGNVTVQLAQVVSPVGISSNEALGYSTVTTGSVTVSPVGISTNETIGNVSVNQTVSPVGIGTTETLGNTSLTITVNIVLGIRTAEALGYAAVTPGDVTVNAFGISSNETVGQAVALQSLFVNPIGIGSAEVLGAATVRLLVLRRNTAEGQTSGTTLTAANSGGGSGDAFGVVVKTGAGTATFDNAQAMHGTRSYHVVAVAAETAYWYFSGTSDTSGAIATYIRFNTLPSASQVLMALSSAAAGNQAVFGITAANLFYIGNKANAVLQTFSTTVVTGTWYRLELEGIPGTTASNGTINGRYFLGDALTPAETAYASGATVNCGTTNLDRYVGGKNTSATATLDAWYDDFSCNGGTTTPIGPSVITVNAVGIQSDQTSGFSNVSIGVSTVTPFGINSNENSGFPNVSVGVSTVSPVGIGTGEALGAVSVALSLAAQGIQSSETVGFSAVTSILAVNPVGIKSDAAIGFATVTTGSVTVAPFGINSNESSGFSNVSVGTSTVSPVGISSSEVLGISSVSTGSVSVSPVGITSFANPGFASVVPGSVTVTAVGITTNELTGLASVTVSAVAVSPVGISSSEKLGNATVSAGPVTVTATGLPSSEVVGYATILLSQVVSSFGIKSDASIGNITISIVTIFPAYEVGRVEPKWNIGQVDIKWDLYKPENKWFAGNAQNKWKVSKASTEYTEA